jgi:hypothetical protein
MLRVATVKASKEKIATQQVVVAPFRNLWMAIPMSLTRKIVRLSDLLQPGEALPETITIDHWSPKVFDLHQHIYGNPPQTPDTHIVVVELAPGEVFAVPMAQLPTIIKLETAQLKPIPNSYRDLYLLEIASHITVLMNDDEAVSVFLVDGDKLKSIVFPD